jgi:inorganic pyrophosphatase
MIVTCASALRPMIRGVSTRMVTSRAIATKTAGDAGTESFRIFFTEGSSNISPWHDIPLKAAGGLFHFVNEIPKNTKAKMEVATKEASNPIAQDIKKGKLRDYHGPIFWNYGCLPQTWEDPNVLNIAVNCKGDNDPVDVVEIGSKAIPSGAVAVVKVLGALAMIDDGELDWKIIAINSEDPLFSELNDISDVEAKCPGVVSGIREWFRWYKTPDDKPLNAFGYDEKALDKKFALEVIEETHAFWKSLKEGKTDKGKLWLA